MTDRELAEMAIEDRNRILDECLPKPLDTDEEDSADLELLAELEQSYGFRA